MNSKFMQELEEILDLPAGSLNEASDFKELPEWDSLAALSVLVMIEDNYKMMIDPSLLENSKTVGELLAHLKAS